MNLRVRTSAAVAVVLVLALGNVVVTSAAPRTAPPAPAEKAVPRAHAHNDYVHPHPLFDALHEGFVGVEADVWLVGSDLRVAHDRAPDWSKVPTLQDAYLAPLARLAADRSNGGVYADGTPALLLIDIKTDGPATYRRLHEILDETAAARAGLLTTYTKNTAGREGWDVRKGAVSVVVSGNRPRELMREQPVRYAAYDGRRADIGPDVKPDDAPAFVPLVSDNWTTFFKGETAWNGTGEIPAAVKAELKRLADAVHAEGKRLRLWNLPKDAPAVWGALCDAGVDLINTDDVAGLAKYLRSRGAGGH
jgi:hypothetical protein